MRMVLLVAVLMGACRRKHAPPIETPSEAQPPQAEAPPAENAPPQNALPENAPPHEVNAPAPARQFGHPPTDDEVRSRLKPLLPALAQCVAQKRPEGPVVLRFGLSPETGAALAVMLAGKPDECAAETLRKLHFEPWSGLPSFVALPLSREGLPMTETDGGLK